MFGGDIKPASFKRALWVISNKLTGADTGSAKKGRSATPKSGKSKSGGKRKKLSSDEDEEPTAGEEDQADDSPTHTPVKKARKTKIKEEDTEDYTIG